MSTKNKWTIAIKYDSKEPARKVTKIIGLNGKGFSVLTPYHKEHSGYLFKMLVTPDMVTTKKPLRVPISQTVGFTAESHVKLTYHTDGFVQFSSEKPGEIISGRDPETGEPKGLGLFTNPLNSPIWTGHSILITLWGLNDFDPLNESDEEALIFDSRHFIYRRCTPESANCWQIALWVFSGYAAPPARWEDGHLLLDAALEPLAAGGRLLAVERLSLLHLEQEKIYLGLTVNRVVMNFLEPSGWIINGPGDYTFERAGYTLQAMYPRSLIDVEGRPALDRDPQTRE